MVEPNMQPKGSYLKRLINSTNPLLTAIGSIINISISVFLISQCFNLNNQQYQRYQDNLIQLQKIDADFNQAVLKSRYELFTSYDPLVRSLQQQRSLLKELVNFPKFISLNTKAQLNDAFKEMNTSLKQKIELSERFKSRNALLKNSLRYLPLLTNQLESKLNETNQNLTSVQIATLGSNLNKLIRKLLIYNVVVDQTIQAEIESLRNDLLQLQIEYGLTPQDFPIDLIASHTNIILNTKPQVEELTSRLVTPVTAKTEVLENLLKENHQRASIKTNIYRIITAIWLLLLLGLLNLILLKKLRSSNPQFSQYKQKVRRIANTLAEALAIKKSPENNTISNISDLTSCRDALGDLAHGVMELSNQIQQEKLASLEKESLAFLTVKLTLVTQNNQKLFTPEMMLKLKVIFEIILDSNDCQLIEIQEARDRVQLLFSYPPRIRLSQLIQNVKIASYEYFQQEFTVLMKDIANVEALWTDAYLIASCDSNFINRNPSKNLLVEKQ